MAKKNVAEELVFCDECGGSIPSNLQPIVVEGPDGKPRNLCQQCLWMIKAGEEQPSLALDDDLEIDESALQSVRHDDAPAQVEVVEEEGAAGAAAPEPARGVPPARAPGPAGAWRHCKTFVSKASPLAIEYMDKHVMDYVKENNIAVRHVTMSCGTAIMGSHGAQEAALFVTLWW